MEKSIPIVFDTSTWILLLNNQESFDINVYIEKGICPIMTMEILLELINVSKENKQKRLNYLKNVSNLSCISYNHNDIGTFIDLRCLEFESIIKNLNTAMSICNSIILIPKNKLAFIEENNLDEFLEYQRSRHLIVSQSIWKLYPNNKFKYTKLKDISFKTNVSEEEFYEKVVQTIFTLLLNSDKKRPEHEKEAAVFEFAKHMWDCYEKTSEGKNPIIETTKKLGIDIDFSNSSMTIGELAEEIEYRAKLEQISELTTITFEQLLSINKNLIPSYKIEMDFKCIYENMLLQNNQRISESSYITDKQMSCFAYLFPVLVDKRTKEILDKLSERVDLDLVYYTSNSIDSFIKIMEKLTTAST